MRQMSAFVYDEVMNEETDRLQYMGVKRNESYAPLSPSCTILLNPRPKDRRISSQLAISNHSRAFHLFLASAALAPEELCRTKK